MIFTTRHLRPFVTSSFVPSLSSTRRTISSATAAATRTLLSSSPLSYTSTPTRFTTTTTTTTTARLPFSTSIPRPRMADSQNPPTGSSSTGTAAAQAVPVPEWIVIIPDFEGARDKRIAIRPQHLAGLKPTIESGFCSMGGAFMAHHPEPGSTDPPEFRGSILLARAPSREVVMEQLRQDIYHHEKVWDLDNVTIYPFKCAVRTAL